METYQLNHCQINTAQKFPKNNIPAIAAHHGGALPHQNDAYKKYLYCINPRLLAPIWRKKIRICLLPPRSRKEIYINQKK
ncbi:hypothetical protein [Rugamonas sp.]|uniref:hypothetical protein n=1 Tax=Rugamonas sp. TaxID=1926287 RepID=UPI0025F27287|nr:hypothetical protein [Rugamonas sp.]